MKSLNSIFKSFRRTLRDLDKFMEEADKHIEYNEKRLTDIQSDQITARWEREKANSARTRIAELIGDHE